MVSSLILRTITMAPNILRGSQLPSTQQQALVEPAHRDIPPSTAPASEIPISSHDDARAFLAHAQRLARAHARTVDAPPRSPAIPSQFSLLPQPRGARRARIPAVKPAGSPSSTPTPAAPACDGRAAWRSTPLHRRRWPLQISSLLAAPLTPMAGHSSCSPRPLVPGRPGPHDDSCAVRRAPLEPPSPQLSCPAAPTTPLDIKAT